MEFLQVTKSGVYLVFSENLKGVHASIEGLAPIFLDLIQILCILLYKMMWFGIIFNIESYRAQSFLIIFNVSLPLRQS